MKALDGIHYILKNLPTGHQTVNFTYRGLVELTMWQRGRIEVMASKGKLEDEVEFPEPENLEMKDELTEETAVYGAEQEPEDDNLADRLYERRVRDKWWNGLAFDREL